MTRRITFKMINPSDHSPMFTIIINPDGKEYNIYPIENVSNSIVGVVGDIITYEQHLVIRNIIRRVNSISGPVELLFLPGTSPFVPGVPWDGHQLAFSFTKQSPFVENF